MTGPEQNHFLNRIRQQQENIIVGEYRQVIHEEPTMQPLTQQQAQRQAELENMAENLAYDNFFQSISALPQQAGVAEGQAPQGQDVGYKERKRRKERYEENKKQNKEKPRLMQQEDKESLALLLQTEQGRKYWTDEKIGGTSFTRKEILQQILNHGDCSNFEKLDDYTRNLVATRALEQMMQQYEINGNTNPAELCQQIKSRGPGVSALLNPALRLGISLACRSDQYDDQTKQILRSLDEEMSTTVMEETLTHVTDKEALAQQYQENGAAEGEAAAMAEAAIKKNKAEQIQIAKRLLLMQLSNFQMKKTNADKTVTYTAWDKSMAVALSHCSRVTLTLPKVEQKENSGNSQQQQKRMWKAVYTIGGENPAGDNSRGASTHDIQRRKVNKPGFAESKEEKCKFFNPFGQRGMNCAIGGLGNAGVGGKMLKNDGSCGHFYSMYKEGDNDHYGAMLMGMESDAYKTKNQLGHTHDLKATGEKASSFGAQRFDEIGDKYGGRQCDLTAWTAGEIADWMELLEKVMTIWQETDRGMQHPDAVAVMRKLAGGSMSNEELIDLYRTLQSWVPAVNPEDAANLTSLPNDTRFQGKSIKERWWYIGRGGSGIINPRLEDLERVLKDRYEGTEQATMMHFAMRNASGTIRIKGLNGGRVVKNLMSAAGGEATMEEIVEMYDNLLSAGQGGQSQEEIQAKDARFEAGFRKLKQLYLAHMRRMKEKYGTFPTQMHPEDFLNKFGIDYFDDRMIFQDTAQMMVDGARYFDYSNPDDAEFKLLSDYYGDADTLLGNYVLTDQDLGSKETFKPTEQGLKDVENSVLVPKLEVSERQLREENPNIKGFTDNQMDGYLVRLRRRFNAEGKGNRLIGRFRKQ